MPSADVRRGGPFVTAATKTFRREPLRLRPQEGILRHLAAGPGRSTSPRTAEDPRRSRHSLILKEHPQRTSRKHSVEARVPLNKPSPLRMANIPRRWPGMERPAATLAWPGAKHANTPASSVPNSGPLEKAAPVNSGPLMPRTWPGFPRPCLRQ